MKFNLPGLVAGVLVVFTAAVHVFVSTPEIRWPLLSSPLPQQISLLLFACWHLVSIALAVSTFVSVMWLLFGLVFVAVGLSFRGWAGLMILPQWILLIPVGVLGYVGARRHALHPVTAPNR